MKQQVPTQQKGKPSIAELRQRAKQQMKAQYSTEIIEGIKQNIEDNQVDTTTFVNQLDDHKTLALLLAQNDDMRLNLTYYMLNGKQFEVLFDLLALLQTNEHSYAITLALLQATASLINQCPIQLIEFWKRLRQLPIMKSFLLVFEEENEGKTQYDITSHFKLIKEEHYKLFKAIAKLYSICKVPSKMSYKQAQIDFYFHNLKIPKEASKIQLYWLQYNIFHEIAIRQQWDLMILKCNELCFSADTNGWTPYLRMLMKAPSQFINKFNYTHQGLVVNLALNQRTSTGLNMLHCLAMNGKVDQTLISFIETLPIDHQYMEHCNNITPLAMYLDSHKNVNPIHIHLFSKHSKMSYDTQHLKLVNLVSGQYNKLMHPDELRKQMNPFIQQLDNCLHYYMHNVMVAKILIKRGLDVKLDWIDWTAYTSCIPLECSGSRETLLHLLIRNGNYQLAEQIINTINPKEDWNIKQQDLDPLLLILNKTPKLDYLPYDFIPQGKVMNTIMLASLLDEFNGQSHPLKSKIIDIDFLLCPLIGYGLSTTIYTTMLNELCHYTDLKIIPNQHYPKEQVYNLLTNAIHMKQLDSDVILNVMSQVFNIPSLNQLKPLENIKHMGTIGNLSNQYQSYSIHQRTFHKNIRRYLSKRPNIDELNQILSVLEELPAKKEWFAQFNYQKMPSQLLEDIIRTSTKQLELREATFYYLCNTDSINFEFIKEQIRIKNIKFKKYVWNRLYYLYYEAGFKLGMYFILAQLSEEEYTLTQLSIERCYINDHWNFYKAATTHWSIGLNMEQFQEFLNFNQDMQQNEKEKAFYILAHNGMIDKLQLVQDWMAGQEQLIKVYNDIVYDLYSKQRIRELHPYDSIENQQLDQYKNIKYSGFVGGEIAQRRVTRMKQLSHVKWTWFEHQQNFKQQEEDDGWTISYHEQLQNSWNNYTCVFQTYSENQDYMRTLQFIQSKLQDQLPQQTRVIVQYIILSSQYHIPIKQFGAISQDILDGVISMIITTINKKYQQNSWNRYLEFIETYINQLNPKQCGDLLFLNNLRWQMKCYQILKQHSKLDEGVMINKLKTIKPKLLPSWLQRFEIHSNSIQLNGKYAQQGLQVIPQHPYSKLLGCQDNLFELTEQQIKLYYTPNQVKQIEYSEMNLNIALISRKIEGIIKVISSNINPQKILLNCLPFLIFTSDQNTIVKLLDRFNITNEMVSNIEQSIFNGESLLSIMQIKGFDSLDSMIIDKRQGNRIKEMKQLFLQQDFQEQNDIQVTQVIQQKKEMQDLKNLKQLQDQRDIEDLKYFKELQKQKLHEQ